MKSILKFVIRWLCPSPFKLFYGSFMESGKIVMGRNKELFVLQLIVFFKSTFMQNDEIGFLGCPWLLDFFRVRFCH